jgi:predicted CXXCH cytochrome family protein
MRTFIGLIGSRVFRATGMGMVVLVVAVWPAATALAARGNGGILATRLREGPGVSNHPVDVVPSGAVTIPSGWPLGADGAITCSTCHEAIPSLEGATEFHLREFDATTGASRDFCVKCHGDGSAPTAGSMHWMAVGVAHVKRETGRYKGNYGMPDAESRRCLGCHDGVTAAEHMNSPLGKGARSVGDRRRSHPVGMEYRDDRLAAVGTRLRPAGLLPRQVRLPGGSVSCVSCHDLYANEPHRLAVPITGSKLCLTCHDMD